MKLTTRLVVVFSLFLVAVALFLGGYAIPRVHLYLIDREITYAETYLGNAAEELSEWQRFIAEAEPGRRAELQGQFLARMNTRFRTFYFHDSGRFFVFDDSGAILVHPDETLRGKTISSRFLYDDGARDRLIQRIRTQETIVGRYPISDGVDPLDGHVHPKTLFVSRIQSWDPHRRLFVSICVRDQDLHYRADLISAFLYAFLLLFLLVCILIFHLLYLSVKRRFATILASARRVTDGDYRVEIGDERNDEIGALARTIDRMARHMRDQARIEEQLVWAQKMEVVGTLASGIAHDFKNILSGVAGALTLVQRDLRKPQLGEADRTSIDAMLGVALRGSEQGTQIVNQLLSFSRKPEPNIHLVDLNRVLLDVAEICRHSMDPGIAVRGFCHPTRAMVKANRTQLEQAILNLCLNARDAMPGGGELVLRIEATEIPGRDSVRPRSDTTTTGLPPGAPHTGLYYRLRVSDTGLGMDRHTLNHLFEPFYTTKPRGKGTGLGLATTYKIIKEHDGWIDVESHPGRGTAFQIHLPTVTTASVTATEGQVFGFRQHPAVLTVAADPGNRQRLADALAGLGYEVRTAATAEEADRVCGEGSGARPELVVLDVAAGSVRQVAEPWREFVSRCQGTPVLLVVPDGADEVAAALMGAGGCGYVSKPFVAQALADALHDALAWDRLETSGGAIAPGGQAPAQAAAQAGAP